MAIDKISVPTVTMEVADITGSLLPDDGRTTTTFAQRLANAKVFTLLDYQAIGTDILAGDDASSALLALIAAATAAGAEAHLPAGTIRVASTVASALSNVTIVGEGAGVTILREHASLGANPILTFIGSSGSHLSNIKLRGLTIRNGTATTADYTAGMNGVRFEYVDGIDFEDFEFTEIQGVYALATKFSTNINLRTGRFYLCTYSMFSVLPECDTIRVTDVDFDTLTTTTNANSYTFAVGGEALADGAYFAKNIWLTRCHFKNNPRWEGLDFHGGENIWIIDCDAENVRVGMLLGLAAGFVSSPVMKNVHVKNWIAVRGTGATDGAGIMITGLDDRTVLAENITIEGGRIEGFGGSTITTLGAITVQGAKAVRLQGITFDEYYFAGVVALDFVFGLELPELKFGNCANPSFSTTTAAISFRSTGVYGARVEACDLSPTDSAKLPDYFFNTSTSSINAQFGHGSRANRVLNVGTGRYNGVGSLPVEKAAIPTTVLRLQYGDVVLTNTGKPGWYCSAPAIGYGSLDTTTVFVTASITAGSATATITASAGTKNDLPPGMNIVIVGAGAAGADLNARVIANNVTSIVLNVTAGTTVVGANVKYQSLTLTAV